MLNMTPGAPARTTRAARLHHTVYSIYIYRAVLIPHTTRLVTRHRPYRPSRPHQGAKAFVGHYCAHITMRYDYGHAIAMQFALPTFSLRYYRVHKTERLPPAGALRHEIRPDPAASPPHRDHVCNWLACSIYLRQPAERRHVRFIRLPVLPRHTWLRPETLLNCTAQWPLNSMF